MMTGLSPAGKGDQPDYAEVLPGSVPGEHKIGVRRSNALGFGGLLFVGVAYRLR